MSPESSALEADSLPLSHRGSPDKFKVHKKIEWEVQSSVYTPSHSKPSRSTVSSVIIILHLWTTAFIIDEAMVMHYYWLVITKSHLFIVHVAHYIGFDTF